MRLYFVLVTLALGIATAAGAALAWDGSYYFFKTIEDQTPFSPFGRLINEPLHWVPLLVNHLTTDLAIVRLAFGLSHAAVPLLALVASWWIVRERAPALFVWPALGIGLGLLPGLFFLVGEGLKVAELFWPIWLAIVVGVSWRQAPLLTILVVAAFVAHPAASPLFAVAAGLAGTVALLDRKRRWQMLGWAAALSVLALARYALIYNGYESEALSREVQRLRFNLSVRGLPLRALALMWLAGGLVFVAGLLDRTRTRQLYRAGVAIALTGLALAGAILVYWASGPNRWQFELTFTTFAGFVQLPFVALAAAEAWTPHVGLAPFAPRLTIGRLRVVQTAGMVMVVVLSVQGLTFVRLTDRLKTDIAYATGPCLARSSLGPLNGTALGHWGIAPLAIAMQGQTPRTLVLEDDACVAAIGGPLRLVPFEDYRGGGWFNLKPVRSRLHTSDGCWFAMAPGWHETEAGANDFFRWSDGHGLIHLFTGQARELAMTGGVNSITHPNHVDVLLNGAPVGTLDVATDGIVPLGPVPLALKAGENVIEIRSRNPAVRIPTDGRLLAIALHNPHFVDKARETACT